MKYLDILQETLLACAAKETDLELLARRCIAGDADIFLKDIMFDNLCQILPADPNSGIIRMDHGFSYNGHRLTLDILKWKDEQQQEPDFILEFVHNSTFESPTYAPNNTRRKMMKCAGYAEKYHPGGQIDMYTIALVTHIYKLDPFYRYKFRGAFYSGIVDARDKRKMCMTNITEEFTSHSSEYEVFSEGVLLRHEGYLGFGVELNYFICDGTFEQRSNKLKCAEMYPEVKSGKKKKKK